MTFKLIKAGAATLALLVFSFSAQAADIPRPVYKGVRSVISYYNWTGFYAGVNGGYGWGTSDWDSALTSIKPKGGMFGGTLGYNYQTGSIVWGLEADIDWSDVKGNVDCGLFVCEVKNEWLSTIRGRIGYAFDRWMPYVTAGGAYGNVKLSSTDPAALGVSKTQFGWTAGVGLEYAFLGNWSAKIEYLMVDLGKFDTGLIAPAVDNLSFKESIVRAGLNYKFSGPIFSRF